MSATAAAPADDLDTRGTAIEYGLSVVRRSTTDGTEG